MMRTRVLATVAGAVVLWCASSAEANGSLAQAWLNRYPDSMSFDNALCALCHADPGGGEPWNAYGWTVKGFKDQGFSSAESLILAELIDSDGDPTGTDNLGELDLSTQPGWTPGLNNTFYFADGSTISDQSPPPEVLGDLDPTASCMGDLDSSGVVDVVDLLGMLAAWGPCPDPCPPACEGDLNEDCEISVTDLLDLLAAWGPCP